MRRTATGCWLTAGRPRPDGQRCFHPSAAAWGNHRPRLSCGGGRARPGCRAPVAGGVADVDDSTLTRALYSSDASLYRVVPQVVARPRHPDELLAILDVAREHRRPGDHARRGHLDRRQRGRPRPRRRHRPAPEPGRSDIDPEARTAVVQPGVVHADLQRAAAPHGLRFGPDPSTHTRCTIGGMIGNNACGSRALGYGRTADNVAGLRGRLRHRRGGRARPAATGAAGPPCTALTDLVGRAPRRTCAPSSAGSPARSAATPSSTCCPRTAADVRPVPRRLRGHARRWCSRPPCGWSRRAGAARLVVLGYPVMAEAADAVPGPARGRRGRLIACEGLDARIVDLRPARRGSAVPDLPRGRRLAVRRGGRRRRPTALGRAASWPRPARWSTRVVGDPREAAALWRIREDGAGLAARSLRHPGVLRLGGRRRAARAPRRLAARLRRAAARARPRRRAVRPLRRRLRARAASTSRSAGRRRARRFRDFLTDAAR